MQRIWFIARNELICALRSRALVMACALMGVLLCAACVLGWQRHQAEADRRAGFQEIVRAQWVEQPDRHPHRVAHYGSFAFRPIGLLGFFDPGVDLYTGTTIYLEAHRRNPPSFSESSQESALLRLGNASPAFILQVLVPLFIVCLAFRTVAGERERGLWRLGLAQGISPRIMVIGKIAGTLLTLAVVLVPFAIAAAAVLAVHAHVDAGAAARIVLLAGGYSLYLAAFAAVAVVLSYWHRRGHTALLTLMAVWIMLWIVAPRVVTAAARMLYPAPPRATLMVAIDRDLRLVGDSHNPNDPYFAGLKERYLERHGVSRVEDLPMNFGGVVMREAEAISSQVHDRHYQRLHRIYARQDRLSGIAGTISPLLAISAWSMAVAGTDSYHAAEFQRQAEAHRYAFIQALNQLHEQEIRWHNDRAQKVDSSRWEQFPRFAYQPPPLAWAVGNVIVAGLGLWLWAVMSVVLVLLVPARRGE